MPTLGEKKEAVEPKKEVKAKGKKSAEKPLVSVSETSQGQIYIEKGVTRNMGDYNSARVTIGVTLPLNPTKEQLEDVKKTIDVANVIVDEEIENQLKELPKK